ncbi:PadR family transcriptional regulator [Pseudonocardia alaniniphila]|uniref:PadR family transcriptional regulator n=1 Tax=Pseudonocardia alaniniphila TaxID=75291 RepID=A0ABS9TEG4_9PSEU|nr:PadR family transcriptional regulator [Pseudonocardia alaniniphila]MCH6166934.1 PadR family transcriptional regulator [Pseudonocardia alaniniphila]
MAKQRRVGNPLALAVLSAVLQRPMHPYEMGRTLREWGKDQDMEIKWGSLYTVVRNLDKHGLVEAVESTRQGARPERTVYRITDAGREELVDWVRELISTPQREHPKFTAGLSVVTVLPPQEAMSLLRERLALLHEEIAGRRDSLAIHAENVPRIFLIETEYELAMREAEAAWIRSVLCEMSSDAFPGLAAWAAWHETGEIPPELREPAERSGTTE